MAVEREAAGAEDVPARSRIGGTLSAPAISPLAIAGAAPRTTTKRIAPSVSLNSRIASGNHAIDGMVCRPVTSEPQAERSTRTRDTNEPIDDADDEGDGRSR